jgi:hypothetical protein
MTQSQIFDGGMNMAKAKKKEWTVMVYLAGDNNLSDECLWAIKEMKRVNVGADVAVTALFDPGEGIPPQIYVFADSDPPPATVQPIDEDDQLLDSANQIKFSKGAEPQRDINTGEPGPLANFIINSVVTYPANNYMVVLGGHGSGEEGDFLSDVGSRDSLNIPELETALFTATEHLKVTKELEDKFRPKGGRIDILGMDSCLMSMIEVGYQLRKTVRYLVGAEGFEPSTGWPYQRILESLISLIVDPTYKPKEAPLLFAKRIVKSYIDYYSDYALAGLSVDLSACDLDGCPELLKTVAKLSDSLSKAFKTEPTDQPDDRPRNHPITDAVLLAHWEAQSYKSDQFTDLYDFCHVLLLRCKGQSMKEIKGACRDVIGAIEKMVKLSCSRGPIFQHSHGLSIYFPWADVSSKYTNLKFSKDQKDNWYGFLSEYVKTTRRKRRKECEFDKKSLDFLQNELFNPSPTESVGPSVVFIPLPIRNNPQYGTKGLLSEIGSMKNPPLSWCKRECPEEKAAGKVEYPKKAAGKVKDPKKPVNEVIIGEIEIKNPNESPKKGYHNKP